jgi:hypothetical protein
MPVAGVCTVGRAGTMTHDYERNGATDLFGAMTVVTGESSTTPGHHSARWLLKKCHLSAGFRA